MGMEPERRRVMFELMQVCEEKKLLGDLDYTKPTVVLLELYRSLYLARTDPVIRRKMVTICENFTLEQRQFFGIFMTRFNAQVAAEANAALAKDIVNEIKVDQLKPRFPQH
ncbi:MAG: hypothetical protein KBF33_05460 [Comamonas sp.]|nr:hypothetical protein [Comamonas sp.]